LNEQSEALADIFEDIKRVAESIASLWDVAVDPDDLTQDMAERLLRDKTATTVTSCDRDARRSYLQIVAKQVASGHLASYEFHSGQYTYTSDDVRELLDEGALVRVTDNDPEDESTTFSVEDTDLRIAFADEDNLSEFHRNILWNEFVDNAYEGHSQNVTRAVRSLTRGMNNNHSHDGPGSRKVVSNSAAQV
jgi:hypothetical protein